MAAHGSPLHFKKLIGEKVYLSPLNPEDTEKFTGWLNDMEVTQFLGVHHHIYSLVKEQEYLDRKARSEAFALAIVDRESEKLIGVCEIFDLDWVDRTAEVGLFVGDKNFWGRGYGRDALRLLVDFGFHVLNLGNIMLRTLSYNIRGIKCFTAVGFQQIGVRRNARTIAGESFDMLFMDITPEGFDSPFVKGVFEKARKGEKPARLEIVG